MKNRSGSDYLAPLLDSAALSASMNIRFSHIWNRLAQLSLKSLFEFNKRLFEPFRTFFSNLNFWWSCTGAKFRKLSHSPNLYFQLVCRLSVASVNDSIFCSMTHSRTIYFQCRLPFNMLPLFVFALVWILIDCHFVQISITQGNTSNSDEHFAQYCEENNWKVFGWNFRNFPSNADSQIGKYEN